MLPRSVGFSPRVGTGVQRGAYEDKGKTSIRRFRGLSLLTNQAQSTFAWVCWRNLSVHAIFFFCLRAHSCSVGTQNNTQRKLPCLKRKYVQALKPGRKGQDNRARLHKGLA